MEIKKTIEKNVSNFVSETLIKSWATDTIIALISYLLYCFSILPSGTAQDYIPLVVLGGTTWGIFLLLIFIILIRKLSVSLIQNDIEYLDQKRIFPQEIGRKVLYITVSSWFIWFGFVQFLLYLSESSLYQKISISAGSLTLGVYIHFGILAEYKKFIIEEALSYLPLSYIERKDLEKKLPHEKNTIRQHLTILFGFLVFFLSSQLSGSMVRLMAEESIKSEAIRSSAFIDNHSHVSKSELIHVLNLGLEDSEKYSYLNKINHKLRDQYTLDRSFYIHFPENQRKVSIILPIQNGFLEKSLPFDRFHYLGYSFVLVCLGFMVLVILVVRKINLFTNLRFWSHYRFSKEFPVFWQRIKEKNQAPATQMMAISPETHERSAIKFLWAETLKKVKEADQILRESEKDFKAHVDDIEKENHILSILLSKTQEKAGQLKNEDHMFNSFFDILGSLKLMGRAKINLNDFWILAGKSLSRLGRHDLEFRMLTPDKSAGVRINQPMFELLLLFIWDSSRSTHLSFHLEVLDEVVRIRWQADKQSSNHEYPRAIKVLRQMLNTYDIAKFLGIWFVERDNFYMELPRLNIDSFNPIHGLFLFSKILGEKEDSQSHSSTLLVEPFFQGTLIFLSDDFKLLEKDLSPNYFIHFDFEQENWEEKLLRGHGYRDIGIINYPDYIEKIAAFDLVLAFPLLIAVEEKDLFKISGETFNQKTQFVSYPVTLDKINFASLSWQKSKDPKSGNSLIGAMQSKNFLADLKEIEKLQRRIYPDFNDHLPDNWGISALYKPAELISGDFFDLYTDPNRNILYFYLLDVSGHGFSSSYLHSWIKSIGRNYLSRNNGGKSPAKFLNELNRRIYQEIQGLFYATCVVAEIDFKSQKIRYASGGHPNGYLLSSNKDLTLLESTGLPIGLFEQAEHQEFEFPFDESSQVLFLSDGFSVLNELELDRTLEEKVFSQLDGNGEQHLLCQFEKFCQNTGNLLRANKDDLTALCFSKNNLDEKRFETSFFKCISSNF